MLASLLTFIHHISLIVRPNIAFRMMHDGTAAKLASLEVKFAHSLGDRSATGIGCNSGKQTDWIAADSSQNGKGGKPFLLIEAMAPVTRALLILNVHHALPVAETSRRARIHPCFIRWHFCLAIAEIAEHRQRFPLTRSEPVDDQS